MNTIENELIKNGIKINETKIWKYKPKYLKNNKIYVIIISAYYLALG